MPVKARIRYLVCFALLFRPAAVNAQSITGYGFVSACDGLRFRAGPSLSSKTIMTLPMHALVIIYGESERKETIDGITAPWYRIKIDKVMGFVFGGYVNVENRYRDDLVAESGRALPKAGFSTKFDHFAAYGFGKTFLNIKYATPLYFMDLVMLLGTPLSNSLSLAFFTGQWGGEVRMTQTVDFGYCALTYQLLEGFPDCDVISPAVEFAISAKPKTEFLYGIELGMERNQVFRRLEIDAEMRNPEASFRFNRSGSGRAIEYKVTREHDQSEISISNESQPGDSVKFQFDDQGKLVNVIWTFDAPTDWA